MNNIAFLRKNKIFIVALILQLIVLVVLVTAIISKGRNLRILSPSMDYWQSRYVNIENGVWTGSEETIGESGDFIYGPFMQLKRGAYSVSVDYAVSESQSIDVYSYEQGNAVKQFEKESLSDEKTTALYHFVLTEDINDLEVRVHYNGSGNILVRSITITDTTFYLKMFTLIIIFIFAISDLVMAELLLKKNGYQLSEVNYSFLKYRSIWMAIAILYVMLHHSHIVFQTEILNGFKECGYGGVDIFFFASGIGCYYSFIKDKDAGNFIKRRILRIMPTYYICIIPWMIYMVFTSNMKYQSVIGNLLCVETFWDMSGTFNWYMSAMWLFYILIPFLVPLIDSKVNSGKDMVIMVIISIALSAVSWDRYEWVIIFSRIPILLIGLYTAKKIKRNEFKCTKYLFLVLEIIMIAGIGTLSFCRKYFPDALWDKGLYWYPFIMIVPGLCVLMSMIGSLLEKNKVGKYINVALSRLGGVTFEIYLIHILMFQKINKWIDMSYLKNNNILWIAAFVLVILCSFALRFILNKCAEKVKLIYEK